jgi:hypothetical protein
VRGEPSDHRRRQLPLAVIMVFLTTLTLWSLGQALVVEAPTATAIRDVASAIAPTGVSLSSGTRAG